MINYMINYMLNIGYSLSYSLSNLGIWSNDPGHLINHKYLANKPENQQEDNGNITEYLQPSLQC